MPSDWECIAEKYYELTDKFYNGYGSVYEKLCAEIGPYGNVLEVGVWKGASLRMWKEVFPFGNVIGVDNLQDSGGVPEIDGVTFVEMNQVDPQLPGIAKDLCPQGYDLVIDDASHKGSLSSRTFDLLWPVVAPGGWYVLEDWAVGVPGNVPYFGFYEGTSMLELAQSFITRAGKMETDVSEFLGRCSIIAIRKAPTGRKWNAP